MPILVDHSQAVVPDSAADSHLSVWLAKQEKLISGVLLLFAVIFNAAALYPEVSIKVPMLNDGVLHSLALERMATAWASGEFNTDFWLPSIALGYPLFHHYQHLPYVVMSAVTIILPTSITTNDVLTWSNYLLLSLFPLSIYWSMRRFEFPRLTAAMGGLVSSLFATNGLYGFDLSSYVWSGYGLYTQLWGMFFLPPALALSLCYMRTGRGLLRAALLVAITLLSHLVMGYIAIISLIALLLLPLLGPQTETKRRHILWQRSRRLLILLGIVALLTVYFWLPFLLDSPYLNRSIWEEAGKIDGYGARWTLSALVRGELFDFGRLPALTILFFAGLIISLRRWQEERYRIPVVLSLLWLLLYFGRPTWGTVLNILPFSGALHLHRFIAGFHLGGIFLVGIALAWPWQWALARRKISAVALAATLTLLLLLPVYRERGIFLNQNKQLMAASSAAYAAEKSDLQALLATLDTLPPGRVYAGNGANWGKAYTIGDIPLYALLNSAGLDMVGYLYHALSLNADVVVHFDESRSDHYDLFNVRYIIAPADHEWPDFVHHVATFGRHSLYQVRTSGYFELVTTEGKLEVTSKNFYSAATEWLASDKPGKKEHPVVLISGWLAEMGRKLSEPGECGEAASSQPPTHTLYSHLVSEKSAPDSYTAVVFVDQPSCLMLKSTYHPNWHVTVDGHESPTGMFMPSYVGVRVQPGIHQVHFEYRPRPQRSLLILVGFLTLFLYLMNRIKNRTEH